MSSAAGSVPAIVNEEGASKRGGRKKLLLLALPLLVIGLGAGLWFTGILPHVLGLKKPASEQQGNEQERNAERAAPVFVDMPEMVANLNTSGRRPAYVKLKARVELAKAGDQAAFVAAQPRVVDLFQTYLREMRPEELRGSAGTYRLRAELIARANIAVTPARITDVLFSELLVQ